MDNLRRSTAAALVLALAPAAASAQVQTEPLPQATEPATRTDRSGRQTGMVTFGQPNAQQVTVRSFEPDSVLADGYRISFEALDTDGDGFIDRAEAAANPTLRGEFSAVDVDGDGRLSREELRGWIR